MNQLRRKLAEGDCKAFSAIFNNAASPCWGSSAAIWDRTDRRKT